MPVQSGAVTFSRFRAEPRRKPPSDTRRWLARGLTAHAFEPIDVRDPEADRAAGFVELEDRDATEFASIIQGGHALFAFRIDRLKVAAAAVRAELERWSAAFSAESGRPPAKRERAAQRDVIRHALRQRAVPSTRLHDVSWNLESGQIQVWAASRKAVDEVAAALEAAFDLELRPLAAGALATVAKIPDAALAPTRELSGLGTHDREVRRGEG